MVKRSKPHTLGKRLPLALLCGLAAQALVPACSTLAAVGASRSVVIANSPPLLIGQDDSGSDEGEVPPQDVKKYVDVYKAMQRNHSLTVEQAAASQGMTLQAFRDLENRVQRDDSALQHARDELQAAAHKEPPPAASTRH